MQNENLGHTGWSRRDANHLQVNTIRGKLYVVCEAAAPASCRINLLLDIVHPDSRLEICAGALCAQAWSRLFRALHSACALPFGPAGAALSAREEVQHLLLRSGLQVTVLQCITYQSENGHHDQPLPSPAAAGPRDLSTARLQRPHPGNHRYLTVVHSLWTIGTKQ